MFSKSLWLSWGTWLDGIAILSAGLFPVWGAPACSGDLLRHLLFLIAGSQRMVGRRQLYSYNRSFLDPIIIAFPMTSPDRNNPYEGNEVLWLSQSNYYSKMHTEKTGFYPIYAWTLIDWARQMKWDMIDGFECESNIQVFIAPWILFKRKLRSYIKDMRAIRCQL